MGVLKRKETNIEDQVNFQKEMMMERDDGDEYSTSTALWNSLYTFATYKINH
jgi:hypothetical protein